MSKVAKHIPTDAEIDLLMQDWFDRDSSTYVRKRTTNRMGWEKETDGISYSSFLAKGDDALSLINNASTLARETLLAMCPTRNLKVRVSDGDEEGMTSKDDVYVGTRMFDDKKMSVNEKLDVFMGLVVHEGCHVRYTERSLFADGIKKFIWNLLEDERIEILCGQDIPGFANFLEKSKYYFFDYARVDDKGGSPLQTILNLLLRIIRYPKYLDKDTLKEFFPYLQRIKSVMSPYPIDFYSCKKASEEIYDIISDFIEDSKNGGGGGDSSEKGDSDNSENSEGSENSDASENSEGSGEGEGKSSGNKSDKDENNEGKDNKPDSSDKDGRDDSKSNGDSKNGSSRGSDSKGSEEERERNRREMEKEFKEISEKYMEATDTRGASEELKNNQVARMLFENEGGVSLSENKTLFIPTTEDKTRYMDSLSRVKRYIPAIRKALECHFKEYKLCHHSMRSGFLDPLKIAEAVQGVPHVYMQNGEVKTEKMSVCLLVDESGSMYGEKITSARDASVLLYEALKGIRGVELFIYGHTADDTAPYYTDIHVVKDKLVNSGKYALGSMSDIANNKDGVAIYEVAKRVRQQTKNPVLYFVISDGQPHASSYFGTQARNHTKEMCKKVEAMDFHVVHVKIDYHDSYEMCQHSISYNNVADFARDFSKEVKSLVKKMTNVVVS